eukprot:TRINITY_DN16980_c0_g1_i1.p1 TRINITY_DN16980_c0_g1~~TRINITY_DN16980_c0_g1_i1.p1  ORF type:complete len:210 (+),score=44.86 TRINITY_DN16980_c0_g1_i1:26-631(+)
MKREFVFKHSKGYRGRTNNNYTLARRQVVRSLNYQYVSRKLRKRDMRSQWIQQVNAACRQFGIGYNQFTNGLVISNIVLNRKMLAELAVNEPYSFHLLVEQIKANLGSSWRDTDADRLTSQYYERFVVDDVPPELLERADLNAQEEKQFAAIRQTFAKGSAKADKTNQEYLKTGKSVKKEAVVRKWKSNGWRNKAKEAASE